MTYDAAGNLTNDTYTGAGNRTYDAENKITSAWGGNNQAQLYAYDASGQRIKRTVNGVETWQVYGFGGELLAEYPANGAPANPQKEYGYRNGQLLVTAETTTVIPPLPTSPNVAAAASGATATASSSYSGLDPANAINGARATGAYWNDFTQNVFPDWLQVTFNGSKTIGEVAIFSLQDNYQSSVEPTPEMTFALYGLTAFDVQYWNGSSWITAASVSGNNKVWRRVTFAPVTTTSIRLVANGASDTWSRIVEMEAYEGNTDTSQTSLRWLVTDHLGTPRMVLDQTGALANMTRHDYLPFGEELFAPTSGRSTAQGYSVGDEIRQQFTRKERDIETGLDYFLARYYSSTQGRFTSPDEFTGGPDELYTFVNDAAENPTFYAELGNPQSLNKYQYTYNNPLRFTDADGHCPVCPVAQRIVQSPTGQQVINAAGAAATTTVVVASGAVKKAWDWFTTPNPNSKGNTVCGMGLDCSGAYSNQYRNQSNEQNSLGNQGQQQGQGQSNTASPNPNDPDKKPVFGESGTQTTSTTVGKGQGWRVDVENPNPGQRPGQIHYQSGDKKYLYDANTKSFVGASKTENKRLLNDVQVQRAIAKGLKVLGEN